MEGLISARREATFCLTEGKTEVVCADLTNSLELVTEKLREFPSEGFHSSLS